MKVIFHKIFVKHFDKRIKPNSKLLNQYIQKYNLFIKDRDNPLLKDHQLKGDLLGKRAFKITSDIRVIYQIKDKEIIEFIDIGTHNQVYK